MNFITDNTDWFPWWDKINLSLTLMEQILYRQRQKK